MFTRLLQATLITSAVYLTMSVSSQQSMAPSSKTLGLMNAQVQPRPRPSVHQLDWLKQLVMSAIDNISQPHQGNAHL